MAGVIESTAVMGNVHLWLQTAFSSKVLRIEPRIKSIRRERNSENSFWLLGVGFIAARQRFQRSAMPTVGGGENKIEPDPN